MPVYSTSDEYKNGYLPQGYVLPEIETVDLNKPPVTVKKPTLFDALAPLPKFKEMDDYNPYTTPGEIDGYESFAHSFIDSQSPQETIAIKERIDARKSVFGVGSEGQFNTLITTSFIGFVAIILLCTFLHKKYIDKFKIIWLCVGDELDNVNTPMKKLWFVFFIFGMLVIFFWIIAFITNFDLSEYESKLIFRFGFYLTISGFFMLFLYERIVKKIVNWVNKGSF